MHGLPGNFIHRMQAVHGPSATAWLARLAGLIRSLEEKWEVAIGPPFAALSYHYVAPGVRRDGTEIVLKLAPPSADMRHEAESLKVFQGKGAVRLLAEDLDAAALLLKRIRPGEDARRLPDEQAAGAVAGVMRELHCPLMSAHPFPTVQDWARAFGELRRRYQGGTGPLPGRAVDKAESLYADLAASMAEPVLLHGDLHPENVLSDGDRWVAVDPQGVLGEPAYEAGAFLRNPIPDVWTWQDLAIVMDRRVRVFGDELGFDRRRLLGWGYAQAVLSAVWSLEEQDTSEEGWLVVAEALEEAGAGG
ncbi:MAG: aminoglycoside phosphotransferase family protein [Anaerolineales bacterium]